MPPDDDFEWLQLPSGGWAIYEQLERVAICLESGVPVHEANRIAAQQVGAGGQGMTPRPPGAGADDKGRRR